MPTDIGAETLGERLTRLRAELARVRLTIARQESNGGGFSLLGGVAVTEIAYERARDRERELLPQILALESRLAGASTRQGMAQLQTRFD